MRICMIAYTLRYVAIILFEPFLFSRSACRRAIGGTSLFSYPLHPLTSALLVECEFERSASLFADNKLAHTHMSSIRTFSLCYSRTTTYGNHKRGHMRCKYSKQTQAASELCAPRVRVRVKISFLI